MSEELIKEAQALIESDEHIPAGKARKLILAIALDNRSHLETINGRLDTVEKHPFHQVKPKNAIAFILGFLLMSAIYIKEVRDFIVGLF